MITVLWCAACMVVGWSARAAWCRGAVQLVRATTQPSHAEWSALNRELAEARARLTELQGPLVWDLSGARDPRLSVDAHAEQAMRIIRDRGRR